MARPVEPFQPQQCRERLLARRPEGVFVNPFERGEIAPTYSALPAASD
jgi:hypothetical protein